MRQNFASCPIGFSTKEKLTIDPVNFNLEQRGNTDIPFIVEIDGSARYNPGPAGIGIRILNPDNSLIKEISRFIGIKTNNQAEYEALVVALKELRTISPNHPVVIKTDSELIYRQLKGEYQVRDKKLKLLHMRTLRLLNTLPKVRVILVRREQNKATDKLAKAASEKGGQISK
ncbi:MAG: ribonuclease HI family protein [bacterium]